MKKVNTEMNTDKIEIDEIMAGFFDMFTNSDNRIPNLESIRELFIEEGSIINNTAGESQIYNLESFIKPRKAILTNGTLTNFREKEISNNTEIYRNIAQRTSVYEKSGELNSNYFEKKGIKFIQFIKSSEKWRITSVTWDDE